MSFKTIAINDEIKAYSPSFLVTRKFSNYYQLHDKFTVTDNAKNKLGVFYIQSIKQILVCEVTPIIAYLDKNIPVETYQEILTKTYGMDKNDILVAIVFSSQKPY